MHNKITINRTTGRTSTPHSKHAHREMVVETLEAEEEEVLVEEEVKLHAITVDNQVTMLALLRTCKDMFIL